MKKRVFAILLALLMIILSSCSSGGNTVAKAYDEALDAIKQGKYAEAADKLAGISFYQDSVQLSLYCRAHAWAAEGRYDEAVSELNKLGSFRDSEKSAAYFSARKEEEIADTPNLRAYAAALYDSDRISGFRDASARAEAIRAKLYQEGKDAEKKEDWGNASVIFDALNDYQDSHTRYGYTTGRMYEAMGELTPEAWGFAAVYYDTVSEYGDSGEREASCLTTAYDKADQLIRDKDFDSAERIYLALGDLCDPERPVRLVKARETAAEAARQARIAEADAMLEEGKFDKARQIYLEADEPEKADEAYYRKAEDMAQKGNAEEAAALYMEISGYKDSRERHYLLGKALMETEPETASRILLADRFWSGAEEDLYSIALKATEAKDYPLSIAIYTEFRGEKDCTLRMMNDLYLYGRALLEEDSPDKAASVFDSLKGMGSADLYANMARYAAAEKLEGNKNYEAAAAGFDLIAGYADAVDRAKNSRYLLALEEKEKGQYTEAREIFVNLKKWKDSAAQETECRYLLAREHEDRSEWENAIILYEALGDYSDSAVRYRECCRLEGERLLANGAPEDAYRHFTSAEDTEGKAKAAYAVGEKKTARMELEEALRWYQLAQDLPETEERTAMVAESLLNMEEDALAEQYASVVTGSEKAQAVLYALALRSLERKDEETAMRQMKKAGDSADASERFKSMLNARVEALTAEEKYDDAAFLCSSYGDEEQVEQIMMLKAQKEEEKKQKIIKAAEAEKEKQKERVDKAAALLEEGSYDEAIKAYQELNDQDMVSEVLYQKAAALNQPELYMQIPEYRDSRELHYRAGTALLDSDPEKAYRILADDISYADVQAVLYRLADRESKAGHYQLSSAVFRTLAKQPLNPEDPKSDCLTRYNQDQYQYGLQLMKYENWKEAAEVFDHLIGIGEATAHARECRYKAAVQLEDGGEYAQAAIAFEKLGSYGDSSGRAKKCRYSAAKEQMEAGEYKAAEAAFQELGDYSDADEMVMECRFREAESEFAAGKYLEAKAIFEKLGDYSEAKQKTQECYYQIAEKYLEQGLYSAACRIFETVADYRDADEKIKVCYEAIGDQEVARAESLLRDGKTVVAARAYQGAYGNYQRTERLEKLDEAALMVAYCYHSVNSLNDALAWYRKNGGTGKTGIAGIAEYALKTEQEELAEALAVTLDTDQGRAILYRMAKAKLDQGDKDAASRLFGEAGNYLDAKEQLDEIRYQQAIRLEEEQKWDAAAEVFQSLEDYKDAEERAERCINREAQAKGRYVFGRYEQDNNPDNGEELIEWIILDTKDGNALLLSKYGLDAGKYHEKDENVSWENCTLRSWLNDEFIRDAFTDKERSRIQLTAMGNVAGQDDSDVEDGADVSDQVFLLSSEEAELYLEVKQNNNIASRVAVTAFAASRGAKLNENTPTTDNEPAGWWWLRSPSEYNCASIVNFSGALGLENVDIEEGVIRPAIWLKLETDTNGSEASTAEPE